MTRRTVAEISHGSSLVGSGDNLKPRGVERVESGGFQISRAGPGRVGSAVIRRR